MKNFLCAILGVFFSCCRPNSSAKQPLSEPISPDRLNHYTGSLYKGNYLWSGAMNLCWTELCQAVIRAPIALVTDDSAAIKTATALNNPVCSKADLDAPSYYVKAGLGPKTVEAINRESRAKFPDKSFRDLKIDLQEQDIISYAYFLKKVAYEMPFTRCPMHFGGQQVTGFEADGKQKRGVEVLHYESNDRFIIRLRLKDPADELLLAKGFDTQSPAALLQLLHGAKSISATPLGEHDFFRMPLLKLDCQRDYPEMVGKRLGNEGFRQCVIGTMFENIAFELDEAGARVESQAVITVERSAAPNQQKRRYFYLDKPFWVLMKRRDAHNPYFLLGVNNTEIMKPQ